MQCDIPNLNLSFYLPISLGSQYDQGKIIFTGTATGEEVYFFLISTVNGSLESEKVFLNSVQQANPELKDAKLVDPKKFGVTYAAEATKVTKGENPDFIYILRTKGHLIMVVTDDPKPKQRTFFFDSIKIKK